MTVVYAISPKEEKKENKESKGYGQRKGARLQGAYRVILSSHRQLSKACLLLKSCPHGFIWRETRDSAEKMVRKNKVNCA